MTNRPPSEQESSQKTALGFDEFIAILVAFLTLGGILFWSIFRSGSGWDFQLFPNVSPTAEPQPGSTSPLSGLEPSTDNNFRTFSSPSADTTVVEPNMTRPLGPLPTLAPSQAPRRQIPFFRRSFESSLKSLPLSLVAPAEKKSTIPPPVAFNDVPSDFWAGRFIDVLSSRGIIKGFPDDSFRPNQPVNRAEFAAILQQAFNQTTTNTTISFKDLPANSWATPAIEQAVGTGFLKGYPDQTFQPEEKIPRVQVLVALVSGLNLPETEESSQVLSIYEDAEEIPQYAIDKIAVATANDLVFNYPESNILAPNQEATRAEVAVMVYQALALKGRVEKISSQNYQRLSQ
ncbi:MULTISPECIES: S-layer homology domain-containing protein [unclassified Anabaena]|uniref:S-layer homology domain-containing protein n=1 Tax=unclassified Anabaena TaxID=2619674 RepID=UPI0039C62165